MAISDSRRTNWDVTWATVALGGVDEVNPDLSLVLADIKIGTYGDMVLGQRVVDMGGLISVQLREMTRTLWATLTPWYDHGAGGADPTADEVGIMPAPGVDLYTHADALILHPHDLDGAVVTEDIELYKAVPITPPAQRRRDGVSDDVWTVQFAVYPDRDKIGTANNPWGRIKASA